MFVFFFGLIFTSATGHKAPHLIFMMADQLRWDGLGCSQPAQQQMNQEEEHTLPPFARTVSWTPNLDALAAEGVRFRNAYSSTPTCTPARSALLTGQKPWNHGMLGYGAIPPAYPDRLEMPKTLDKLGYRTISVGKDHFGWNNTSEKGVAHGYQETSLYDGIVAEQDDYHSWFESRMAGRVPESGWPTLDMNSWRGAPYVYNDTLHPTYWVGELATSVIKAANTSVGADPLFLKISFHRPHSPYDPPARLLERVAASDLPAPAIATDGWDKKYRGTAADPAGCGPSSADAWCGLMPSDATDLARRAYRASIMFVDEQVGRVVDALKDAGMYEDSILLFTSDHGDGQGDHYHWRKGYPYEFSSHIPMLLFWGNNTFPPSSRRGAVLSEVVELRDVFPTFLHAAGDRQPGSTIDGHSLLCLVQDDPDQPLCPAQWRQVVDLEHSTCYNETNHWNALTDAKTKYIFNAFSASEQLFNLTSDPLELVDLAPLPQHQPTLRLWREKMVKQFQDEGRGPTWVKDGKLMQRTKGETYGPNFPKQY